MGHLRRSLSPEWWPIKRKGYAWAIRSMPGPHPAERSMPLAVVIRDILHYAETLREARLIIGKGYVKVDGRVRRDYRYPVGLMDVVELTPLNEYYRVIPDPVNYLKLVKVDKSEANIKVCRIENKTMVKGGRIQLNLHDGRNYVVDQEEGKKYETLGSVVIDLEKNAIVDYIPMAEGNYVMAFEGVNVGKHGTLANIARALVRRESIATIKGEGGEFKTILDYLIVIGRESPIIKVS